MHGGYIGATSNGEGTGCTFYFEIPCFSEGANASLNGTHILQRNDSKSSHFGAVVPPHRDAGARTAPTGTTAGAIGFGVGMRGRVLPLSSASDDGSSIAATSSHLNDVARKIQKATGSANSSQHDNSSPRISSQKANMPTPLLNKRAISGKLSMDSALEAANIPTPHLNKRAISGRLSMDSALEGGTYAAATTHLTRTDSQLKESDLRSVEGSESTGKSRRIVATTTTSTVAAGAATSADIGVDSKLSVSADSHNEDNNSKTPSGSLVINNYNNNHSNTKHYNNNNNNDTKKLNQTNAGVDVPLLTKANLASHNDMLKVLLADDAPLSRKMLARTLASLCEVIDHANNGLEACDKVVQSLKDGVPYDVVIIDNYMPVMNGDEAIKKMREKGFQGVILSATGSTSLEDRALLICAGADAVMIKPLTLHTFQETMNGEDTLHFFSVFFVLPTVLYLKFQNMYSLYIHCLIELLELHGSCPVKF